MLFSLFANFFLLILSLTFTLFRLLVNFIVSLIVVVSDLDDQAFLVLLLRIALSLGSAFRQCVSKAADAVGSFLH